MGQQYIKDMSLESLKKINDMFTEIYSRIRLNKVSGIIDDAVNAVNAVNANTVDEKHAVDLDYKTTVKVRAILSAQQSNITNYTFVKIALDTAMYDLGSNFDTVNNRFIIPITGYYIIIGRFWIYDMLLGKEVIIALYKNGINFSSKRLYCASTGSIGLEIADIRYLNATDYIELWVRHAKGDDTPDILSSPGYTFLSIHLLSKD